MWVTQILCGQPTQWPDRMASNALKRNYRQMTVWQYARLWVCTGRRGWGLCWNSSSWPPAAAGYCTVIQDFMQRDGDMQRGTESQKGITRNGTIGKFDVNRKKEMRCFDDDDNLNRNCTGSFRSNWVRDVHTRDHKKSTAVGQNWSRAWLFRACECPLWKMLLQVI